VARAELLPFASKMPVPAAQARKFARKRVAGKLARRDDLLLQLLRGFWMVARQFVELYFTPSQSSERSAAQITNSSFKTPSAFHPRRTTKRFPSPRCASAIQIVRPLESIVTTQPQFHPALLRLSVIISDTSRAHECDDVFGITDKAGQRNLFSR
jgi:hypothetical protein